MKIISYNLNGIRAALKKDLVGWLKEENPDVFCVQETKSHREQVDFKEIEALGYHSDWHSAVKKGYSGVATFSKIKPNQVTAGIGIEKYDSEGRVLISHFDKFTLLNCYFPSGSSGEERHQFKMDFLHDLRPWMDEFRNEHPNVVLVGDYNIVHTELDIHNPTRKDNPSGYRPEERQWLTEWFDSGFTDAYRYKNGDQVEFSWWSYRAGSRGKNKGWRIDYLSVANSLKEKVTSSQHHTKAVHSDHCAIEVVLDL